MVQPDAIFRKLSVMRLQWSNEFSVYDDEIDSQHQELFRIINKLDTVMRRGEGVEELTRIIEFLDQYVTTHFSTEETFMTRHGYPGYALHRGKHLWFASEFDKIRKSIEADGPTPDNIVLANYLLISWFSNHIRTLDKLLGNFLRNGEKSPQVSSNSAR